MSLTTLFKILRVLIGMTCHTRNPHSLENPPKLKSNLLVDIFMWDNHSKSMVVAKNKEYIEELPRNHTVHLTVLKLCLQALTFILEFSLPWLR